MTFLELCRRVREESAVTTAGPDTVIGQRDMLAKIVNWVRAADYEIQCKFCDWSFLWSELQSSLTAGNSALVISDCKALDVLEVATAPLTELDHHVLRRLSASGSQGRPTNYAVAPDGDITLYPKPDAAYPCYASYYRKPTTLALDGDVSAIPAEFHMIIVYRALAMLATSEQDQAMLSRSEYEYELMLQALANRCRPTLRVF
nr:MAG TPA: head to tail adaptor [Caudoviricetes sp.]